MSEIKKILEIAYSEIGYLEKANNNNLDDKTSNSGSNNYTKYARDMDNINVYNGKKQGYPWCNVFIDWCFVKAVGIDRSRELLIGFSAGCTQDYNWFRAKNQIVNTPQIGDLIFFADLSHIGIIENISEGTIYTIEGNTSNKAELIINGGTVAKKSYLINSKSIYGYARPKYDSSSDINSNENSTNNQIVYSLIKKGSKGNLVRIAQEKLITKGYRLPKFGADGIFGEEVENAVRQLQQDAKIAVDGIIGKDTWSVLNSDFIKQTISYPGYLIKKGQQSEEVRKIQEKLISLGYNCGGFGADSIFGRGTYNSVIEFQKSKGLSPDGIVGPDTWNKLF